MRNKRMRSESNAGYAFHGWINEHGCAGFDLTGDDGSGASDEWIIEYAEANGAAGVPFEFGPASTVPTNVPASLVREALELYELNWPVTPIADPAEATL